MCVFFFNPFIFVPFIFAPFEQGLAAPVWVSVFSRTFLPFEQGLVLYLPLLLSLVLIQDEAVDGICQESVAKGCPCRLVPLVPHMLLMWCGDGVQPFSKASEPLLCHLLRH